METLRDGTGTPGRLGAVLRAVGAPGPVSLGRHGPWLATTYDDAREVLTDLEAFVFPVDVSRHSAPGRHPVTPRLDAEQLRRGLAVLDEELPAAVRAWDRGPADAMDVLRDPLARSTVGAVLDLAPTDRDGVAALVLAWIDALGPVIAATRPPSRWSRTRRAEQRAKDALERGLAALGTPHPERVAVVLAAGIQVPVAAGAWLLVLLAEHPEVADRVRDPGLAPLVAWETVRLRPPTWVTARLTTREVALSGTRVPEGAVVLVSPLLLGRLAPLVPGPDRAGAPLDTFDPRRWQRDDVRPGAWLPFGAGPHACPGRNLGLAQLAALARWAAQRRVRLETSAGMDQTRGIFPRPAVLTCHPLDLAAETE